MAEKEKRGMFSRLFGGSKATKEADVEENPTAVLEEQTPVGDESSPAATDDVEDTIGEVAVIDPPELTETPEREPQSDTFEEAALPEQTEAPDAALNQPNGDEPGENPEKEEEKKEEKKSWFKRLKQGLSRSSSALGGGITGIFTKRKLDDETLEELEDVLIQADLGVETALAITEKLAETRYNKEISDVEVKTILAEEVKSVLEPVAQPLDLDSKHKPHVVLMIGVNGTGKTTTIGKLASKLKSEGKKVMMAAGDTFRAAAVEQLKIWGERTGSPVIAGQTGADAAGLAFDAMKTAQEQGTDVLLIDTAGRLQNKAELMDELKKVIRVIKKHDESAPHSVLLTLDATTGQNALSQVEIFGKTADVTGLVMTKLDGTARGGILVAIARKYQLPVHFIGVGEGIEDLEPFSASDFAKAIAGLD